MNSAQIIRAAAAFPAVSSGRSFGPLIPAGIRRGSRRQRTVVGTGGALGSSCSYRPRRLGFRPGGREQKAPIRRNGWGRPCGAVEGADLLDHRSDDLREVVARPVEPALHRTEVATGDLG